MNRLVAVGAASVMVAASALAAAQSTRYPPPEPDLDAEREEYSDFWENAIEPGRTAYDDLIERARKLLARRTSDTRDMAIELLEQATELLPERAEGWAWLGQAHEEGAQFADCHSELEQAWRIDPAWDDGPRSLALMVGHCRAKAGDLDGAIEVLERLVARGDEKVETMWRLGEVYMALGRLDDARAVLEIAIDQSPADPLYAYAAWALAVAADRARDPEATRDAGEIALRNDPQLARTEGPGGHLVRGDADYYSGLALDLGGQWERALVRFRRYARAEEDGPWASRARERERALRGFDISTRAAVQGSDPLDLKKVGAVLDQGDVDLRACVEKTPGLLLQLRVTMHGPKDAPAVGPVDPKKPRPQRRPSSSPAPPAGVRALVLESAETDDKAVSAAIACVEQVGAKLKLPSPQTSGTWATVSAPVIWR